MADDDKTTDVKRPAPPGFPGPEASWNSDDARRAYDESGHDFDKIQSGEEPQTFADGRVAPGTAPEDDLAEPVKVRKAVQEKAAKTTAKK